MKNVALHNLGCKVNSYEMDFVQQKLQEKGYKIVAFDKKADVYIVNTCSVTNIADRKSRQMLHRAKKLNPEAVVVAMGCYVQAGKEEALKDDCIDLAIGNNRKKDLVEILEAFLSERQSSDESKAHTPGSSLGERRSADEGKVEAGGKAHTSGSSLGERRSAHDGKAAQLPGNAEVERKTLGCTTIIDIGAADEYEEMMLTDTAEHTRAYIKIQDGCNQFCTYCIIPYARGRVRSRRMEEIVKEISGLRDKGYREIVLTGIHISSYGLDWDKKPHLLELIRRIHEISGIERIRIGSLEPRIVTEEFARELSGLHKVCPHFHLSLQSGCDKTLKAMNRRYDTEEFLEKVLLLRRYFDAPAITTDVIVGFPGETEEDFAITEEFLRKVQFFEMHIFPYSRREGTRAASMPGQLTEAEKKMRSHKLFALEREQSDAFRRQFLGKQVEVLFEEEKELDGQHYYVGYTREYMKAAIRTDENLSNVLKSVEACELRGELLLVRSR
ncbi:MAG: tRNA (N(6)-L-threonylcarbamoyladenosine(37)-C(2))-methylthiotransferase MtaB [Lachnospiraceae bacterium]|nr:tRNA (N(6)-L-threonylcarbamoyladenosine(37)-C(2))-methylthiotransferase MtaB [Lachnospiraceae bacterium]